MVSNVKENLERLVHLASLAKEAISAHAQQNLEGFTEKVELYMSELEAWQQTVAGKGLSTQGDSEDNKSELRQHLSELSALHQVLMDRANESKNRLGSSIGALNRRASGLKKYVRAPSSSLSITRKRKG